MLERERIAEVRRAPLEVARDSTRHDSGSSVLGNRGRFERDRTVLPRRLVHPRTDGVAPAVLLAFILDYGIFGEEAENALVVACIYGGVVAGERLGQPRLHGQPPLPPNLALGLRNGKNARKSKVLTQK